MDPLIQSLSAYVPLAMYDRLCATPPPLFLVDVALRGRTLNAKVLMPPSRLFQLEATFTPGLIHTRCSCGVSASGIVCDHAGLALIEWTKRYTDHARHFLSTLGEDPIMAAMAVDEKKQLSRQLSRAAAARLPRLAEILRRPPAPGLTLFMDLRPPSEEDGAWRLQLHLEMGSRRYAASNIARLLEEGTGSGQIAIEDIPCTTQRLMHFLHRHCPNLREKTLVIPPEHGGDFLLLLRGLKGLSCQGTPFTVHQEPAQLILLRQEQKAAKGPANTSLQVAVRIGPDLYLQPSSLRLISSPAGEWALSSHAAWLLSPALPPDWVRDAFTCERTAFTPAAIAALQDSASGLPLPIVESDSSQPETASHVKARPHLAMDWNMASVRATFFCSYDGALVDPGSDTRPCLVLGRRLMPRDFSEESRLLERLAGLGFSRSEEDGSWRLGDFSAILRFIARELRQLDTEGWVLSTTAAASSCLFHPPALRLHADRILENSAGIQASLLFLAGADDDVALSAVQQALRLGHSHVVTRRGHLAAIQDDLRQALLPLTEMRLNAGELRLPRHFAPILAHLLNKHASGEHSDWSGLYTLSRRPPEPPPLPPALDAILRPYQRDGLHWLLQMHQAGAGAILADEMGLGKTVQALALLSCMNANRTSTNPFRALVVCPTSLIENWLEEARHFTPELKAAAIHGNRDRHEVIATADNFQLLITSYALLRRDAQRYLEHRFDAVILDEAQAIKNPQSQAAVACRSLNSDLRLILTGTPLENGPLELWSLFEFIVPGLLGSRARMRAVTMEAQDESARQLLAAKVRPFILRRTKAEVARELPPKTEQTIHFELSDEERQAYTALTASLSRELFAADGSLALGHMQILALLTRLRQLCCHHALLPKSPLAASAPSSKFELFKELLEEALPSTSRMLVFSQFTSMLSIIRAHLDEMQIPYLLLDGSTANRQELVNTFNQDERYRVFLLSLKAGGTGLNLTGADTVIHYDPWWNPMAEDQASDRAHRIGQTRPVRVIRLAAKDSIEDRILQLQSSKRQLFNDLMNGSLQSSTQLREEDLRFLLS